MLKKHGGWQHLYHVIMEAERVWSGRSLVVYVTLDPRLQQWVTRVRDEVSDITLLDGYRSRERQQRMYDAGLSKLKPGKSKHNIRPAQAVDFQPYPRPISNEKLWAALGYIVGRGMGIADDLGFQLRWGGDWDRDGELTDQEFDDGFHVELL